MIASLTCIRSLASRTSLQSIQVARHASKLHEKVGYTNPFSQQESTIILDKVNSLSAAELSKFITKKGSSQIAKHRTTKGLFNELGELLELQGFHPNAIEKMGCAILNLTSKSEEKEEAKVDTTPQSTKGGKIVKLLKHMKPRPDAPTLRGVRTVCAVKMSAMSLSYVHLDVTSDQRPTLLEWEVVKSFDGVQADKDHTVIYNVAYNLAKTMPQADLYVFEEMMPIDRGGSKDPYLSTKVKLLELQASLICHLNHKVSASNNVVHLMKFTVIDEMFDLRVGSERVMLPSNKFKETIKETATGDNEHSIQLDDRLIDLYEAKAEREREQLGLACLNAVAFCHLLQSLKAKVKSKSKDKKKKKSGTNSDGDDL